LKTEKRRKNKWILSRKRVSGRYLYDAGQKNKRWFMLIWDSVKMLENSRKQ